MQDEKEIKNKFSTNIKNTEKGNTSHVNTYEMIKKCPDCGIRMKYIYGETFECPACGRKMLSDFGLVRQYLDEKGPQPAIVISEATGVKVDVIDQFLREGRVEIPDGSGIYIHCQSCGTDIRYGRFCPECMLKMTKQLGKALLASDMGEKPTHKSSMSGKMHLTERAVGEREHNRYAGIEKMEKNKQKNK